MANQILIGGCGSSGTTLLRKMMNNHPNIACGPEMSVFDRPLMYSESIDYLYTLWRAQDFDPLDAHCIYPLRINNRLAADLSYCGLLHDNHMKFYHDVKAVDKMFEISGDIPSFLDEFFAQYAVKENKRVWAEKTPNNIFCADLWLDAFPDGVFINLVRDGRDAVLSMNLRRKVPIYVATYRWIAAVHKWLELVKNETSKAQKPEDIRIKTIKYEDLILKTEDTLKGICEFIGEPYSSDMLFFNEKELPEDKESGLQYATTPVHEESIGRYLKNDYDPTILDQINIAIRPLLGNFGYEIE